MGIELRLPTVSSLVPALLLLFASGIPAGAQEWWAGAGGGAVTVTGDNRELWGTGPTAFLSVEWRSLGTWGLRFAGQWGRLEGKERATAPTLTSYGGAMDAVWRSPGGIVEPYLLAGGGRVRRQVEKPGRNPYETTATLHFGGGLEIATHSRVRPFAESRYVLHLADYGFTQDFNPMDMVLIWIGIRVARRTPAEAAGG